MHIDSHSLPGLRALFLAALEFDDADERTAFLDQACPRDDPRRQNIEQLLAAYASTAVSPLDRVASQLPIRITLGPAPDATWLDVPVGPEDFDRYRLLQPLGEGAFGVVYDAEQTAPVRRRVAVKIIKPGMDSREVVARFEAERQTLALMDHPHVARVFDAGATPAGRPYFVMELVRGEPIGRYCDEAQLDTAARLELFVKVCQGVQHAHQKGIIHRDLKPGNILVTSVDGVPVPKVIDFGVAKALYRPIADRTVYTQPAQLIGTPLYMSPEQAATDGADIDTRTDVYSLGVMLYELLTGVLPFDRSVLATGGVDAYRALVRQREPTRPSVRISQLGQMAGDGERIPSASDTRVTAELDWIVLKSLEKDRERRYESAQAFAADVRRYLNGEPVLACPPTVRYRVTKFVRRHRHLLVTALLLVMTMLAGTIVAGWQAVVATREAERASGAESAARRAQTEAERQAERAKALAREASRAAEDARQAQQREAAERQRAQTALYVSDIRVAAAEVTSGSHAEALSSLQRHLPAAEQDDLRSWEWYYLRSRATRSVASWRGSSTHLADIDWRADGHTLATASHDGSCRLWDPLTGAERQVLQHKRLFLCCVVWSPDGRQLAWGGVWPHSGPHIWDAATGATVSLDADLGSVWCIAWSHDGQRLVSGALPPRPSDANEQRDPRNLVLWKKTDAGWQADARQTLPENVLSIDWSPDQSRISVNSEWGGVELYDAQTLRKIREYAEYDGPCAKWHPTRPWLCATTSSGDCVVHDMDQSTARLRFRAHHGGVQDLAWSPNGDFLATAGRDGVVRIWKSADGTLLESFSGHDHAISAICWNPDSSLVASCGPGGLVNIWPTYADPPEYHFATFDGGKSNLFAWTEDNLIRTLSDGGEIVDRDPRSGEILRTVLALPEGEWALRSRNAVSGRPAEEKVPDSMVLVLQGSEAVPAMSEPQYLGSVWCSDAGDQFAAQPAYHAGLTWRIVPGGRRDTLGEEPVISVRDVDWSPDNSRIAVAGQGRFSDAGNPKYAGWLHLYNGRTGAAERHLRVGKLRVSAASVDWGPQGRRLAAANVTGLCEVFDSHSHQKLVSRKVHRLVVNALSWHPRGRRVASGSDDRTVAVWDAASGEVLLRFTLPDSVRHVAWSPDGMMLAAQDVTGGIHVWDATRGYSTAGAGAEQDRGDAVDPRG